MHTKNRTQNTEPVIYNIKCPDEQAREELRSIVKIASVKLNIPVWETVKKAFEKANLA